LGALKEKRRNMVGDSSLLHTPEVQEVLRAWIFDIQRYSINDGPGVRTTVFFKGCPLTCLWCDNPESQEQFPQLFFFDLRCARCYRCIPICPHHATVIKTEEGTIEIDRELCQACGLCVKVCYSGARAISGRLMTVDEVLEIVKEDTLFYRNSGGGVTASGGEPTSQPEFLLEFFRRCQEIGIHTTLDTCGYVRWEILERILEYTELVLFDIKHMDPVRHLELTGVDNKLILENVHRIVQRKKPLKIRMPLIPRCNDSEENIEAIGEFLTRLGIHEIDLLPYHQLGTSKYKRIGKSYKLNGTKSFQENQVESIKKKIESFGIRVFIL
jgi:pyruvate formate lyase activating enzyme